MERPGHDGGVEPLAFESFPTREVPIHIDGSRRPALADNRRNLGVSPGVHEHERLATQAVEILFEHAPGEERCHARVERVPAFDEDAEGRGGGERVACGHTP